MRGLTSNTNNKVRQHSVPSARVCYTVRARKLNSSTQIKAPQHSVPKARVSKRAKRRTKLNGTQCQRARELNCYTHDKCYLTALSTAESGDELTHNTQNKAQQHQCRESAWAGPLHARQNSTTLSAEHARKTTARINQNHSTHQRVS